MNNNKLSLRGPANIKTYSEIKKSFYKDIIKKSIREQTTIFETSRNALNELTESGQHDLRLRLIASQGFGDNYIEDLLENGTEMELREAMNNPYLFVKTESRFTQGDRLLLYNSNKLTSGDYLNTLVGHGFEMDNLSPEAISIINANYNVAPSIFHPLVKDLIQRHGGVVRSKQPTYSTEEQVIIENTKAYIKENSNLSCFDELDIQFDSAEMTDFCEDLNELLLNVNNMKIKNKTVPKFYTRTLVKKSCFIQPVLMFDKNDEKLITATESEQKTTALLKKKSHALFTYTNTNKTEKKYIPFTALFDFAKNTCPGFILTYQNSIDQTRKHLLNINLDRYQCLFDNKPLDC